MCSCELSGACESSDLRGRVKMHGLCFSCRVTTVPCSMGWASPTGLLAILFRRTGTAAGTWGGTSSPIGHFSHPKSTFPCTVSQAWVWQSRHPFLLRQSPFREPMPFPKIWSQTNFNIFDPQRQHAGLVPRSVFFQEASRPLYNFIDASWTHQYLETPKPQRLCLRAMSES